MACVVLLPVEGDEPDLYLNGVRSIPGSCGGSAGGQVGRGLRGQSGQRGGPSALHQSAVDFGPVCAGGDGDDDGFERAASVNCCLAACEGQPAASTALATVAASGLASVASVSCRAKLSSGGRAAATRSSSSVDGDLSSS